MHFWFGPAVELDTPEDALCTELLVLPIKRSGGVGIFLSPAFWDAEDEILLSCTESLRERFHSEKNQLLLVTQFPTRSVQKINCQIIRDASFVEFHKNSGQITHWKIKHLLPAQSVSPSEQGFACVNDRYHLEAEDWQARRQLKIITGHLRITEGICHCHSVC